MRGGVLSIRNGSLTIAVESASAGGLPGRSDAVTRMRYSPSGNAVESQLQYFSRQLVLKQLPVGLMRAADLDGVDQASPLSSEAAQRAPTKPLAYCMEGVPGSSKSGRPKLDGGFPIGGRVSVGEGGQRNGRRRETCNWAE